MTTSSRTFTGAVDLAKPFHAPGAATARGEPDRGAASAAQASRVRAARRAGRGDLGGRSLPRARARRDRAAGWARRTSTSNGCGGRRQLSHPFRRVNIATSRRPKCSIGACGFRARRHAARSSALATAWAIAHRHRLQERRVLLPRVPRERFRRDAPAAGRIARTRYPRFSRPGRARRAASPNVTGCNAVPSGMNWKPQAEDAHDVDRTAA